MIFVVGQAPISPHYTFRDFEEFLEWVSELTRYQLDVETVPAPHWIDRKIRCIQFGFDDVQYVIQPHRLTPRQQQQLIAVLLDPKTLKIIHNAYFELTVFKLMGLHVQNVYCTFLAEKIIWGGYTQIVDYSKLWQYMPDDNDEEEEMKGYSLEDVAGRRLCLAMDKDEEVRMSFGDGILTERKVLYAAQDVQPLEDIMRQQVIELTDKNLSWVAALEMDAVISYAEMTAEGMKLDIDGWRANIDLALPLVAEAKEKLDRWIVGLTVFEAKAYELGYVSDKDRVQYNWNSHQQKAKLMLKVLPMLPGTTKAILKKWVKDNKSDPELVNACKAVAMAADGDMSAFDTVLLAHHRQWLIDEGFLVPAGTTTINWNSVPQVLPLFQLIEPAQDSLSKDALGNFPHPISDDLQEYKNTLKLTTAFGEKFIQEHVERDGRVRSEFNQIVNTGRVSSRKPNMQQIPAKEEVGNRYRNCFLPHDEGWLIVDSDYASQELVMIAFISNDPVWLGALKRGEDLHSVCAELVFGQEWKRAAEKDCAYYALKPDGTPAHQKCKCKGHKTLRTDVKTINFGLAYGMSEFKLARTKQCSVPEAKALIADYFRAFPKIKKVLDYFGGFAVSKGFIMTLAPFGRKRWFPKWHMRRRNIIPHLRGIKHDKILGEIERAGKNTPIQGGAADITKLSLCLIRWYIEDNGLRDRVKLWMQVHDQNSTLARKDYAEEWKPILTDLMRQAGQVVVTNGLLDAETNITERWSK